MLTTDGTVILRTLAGRDLEAFQAYRSDPEVARYQDWDALSDDRARGFLEAMSHVQVPVAGEWVQIGISRFDNRALLGDLGICLAADGQKAEIGITLSRHAQGRGIATRAYRLACSWVFETTPAQVIEGIADVRNLKSLRLFERLGMPVTDTLGPEPVTPDLVERVHAVSRPDQD